MLKKICNTEHEKLILLSMNFYRMKALLLFIGIIGSSIVFAGEGEDLFKSTCAACHTIGKGKLIGPDLKNITEKRSRDWLLSFIVSPSKLINSGDADAKTLFEEYNKLLMPDNNFTNAQVMAILTYISGNGSDKGQGIQAPAADILSDVAPENINSGAHLFDGKQRLTNRGPTCSSCHNVADNRVFSSGTLAKDLSESYDILGSAGLASIIKNPPFPVMKQAYYNHAVTEAEVMDLTAFLKSVSEEGMLQSSSDFSILFLGLGLVFFVVIFISTIVLYFKRKKLAVHHHILSRPSGVVN